MTAFIDLDPPPPPEFQPRDDGISRAIPDSRAPYLMIGERKSLGSSPLDDHCSGLVEARFLELWPQTTREPRREKTQEETRDEFLVTFDRTNLVLDHLDPVDPIDPVKIEEKSGDSGWRSDLAKHRASWLNKVIGRRAWDEVADLPDPSDPDVPASRHLLVNDYDYLVVVLLGKRVSNAMRLYAEYLKLLSYESTFQTDAYRMPHFVIFPHPSGRNRWWNDPVNWGRARCAVRSLLATARGGCTDYRLDRLRSLRDAKETPS